MKRWCIGLCLLCASGVLWAAAQAPHVNVIGLLGSKAILRIDGEQVMLSKGEQYGDVRLLDVQNGQAVLRIGQQERRLGMGMDTGGISEREAGPSVNIAMNANGQYITAGKINGVVVQFLVDTGANTISMTTEDARRLGIDYQKDGEPSRSMTAGGVVRAWGIRLRTVQIGPITVKNVQASIREAPSFGPILLGMSFLSRVDMQHGRHSLSLTGR